MINIKNKKNILIIALILFLMIFIFLNRYNFFHNRKIKFENTIPITSKIKDFNITFNSIIAWDGQTLYFCTKNGELFKREQIKSGKLEAFFVDNYCFIYDRDIDKIYEYSDTGKLINSLKTPASVFNIKYENNNIIFQLKDGQKEYLYALKSNGNLEKIYETSNPILCFSVYDYEKNFSVSELSATPTGYKNILNIFKPNDNYTKEFNAEIALYLNTKKNNTIIVTDKNLYKIDNKTIKYKEVPNISTALIDENNIYLLHSDVLSKYDMELNEKKKYILSIKTNKITKISNSIYVYGKNDIGGEIGEKNEFYSKLGSEIDKMEIKGLTIATLSSGKINVYKIVNSKDNDKNILKKISKNNSKE